MVLQPPRAGSVASVTQAPVDDGTSRRPSLRDDLAHDYRLAFGRVARQDTLDALEDIVRWLRRTERLEGRQFLLSVSRAARELGWETVGRTTVDRNRHRNSLVRRLDMLTEMGVVETFEPLWSANLKARGILVALRRDSSVGGANYAASVTRPVAA